MALDKALALTLSHFVLTAVLEGKHSQLRRIEEETGSERIKDLIKVTAP